MKAAFLFPGQGSQQPEMLHALPGHRVTQDTLSEASEILDKDVLTLDSEEELASTRNVQLALLIAEVALARLLITNGAVPDAVAGHSVGAFAAAVIAGSLTFSQALRAVCLRGRLMEDAFPQGYGMAAITGLAEKNVRVLLEKAAVYIANINTPDQITIAGSRQGLQEALTLAREAGAQKVQYLNVSVPSHCPLLQPVAEKLAAELAAMEIHPARIPYVGNCRARLLRKPEAVRDDLASGVAASVRWHDMTSLLVELGTAVFVETGPGQVLTSMAMKAFPAMRAVALANAGMSSAVVLVRRAQCAD